MQIDITAETILKQLKINVNDKNLAQMQVIIDNTKEGDRFFKHLFSLNDSLASMDAFIAPSNSVDLLKIKYHGNIDSQLEDFDKIVAHWSEKHKVYTRKAGSNETYYIEGFSS